MKNVNAGEEQGKALKSSNLREIASLFLRLGATAFGGPAAHIAMMEREVVEKRGWLSREDFLDLLGATNLIPGPNSTELAIHLGYVRGGWRGLLLAGICFIAPAFFLVLAFAAFYENFSALPQMQAALLGMAPVVVAIVAEALWKFAETALASTRARFAALLAIFALLAGAGELTALAACATFGMCLGWREPAHNEQVTKIANTPSLSSPRKSARHLGTTSFFVLLAFGVAALGWLLQTSLFLSFLKIGSVLYGSGYVLLSFLQSEFVPRVLAQQQLLDAVAIGQITPGPVFTTATFIGYQIGGWRGAIASTLGIFLPSFVFVALLSRLLEKLKTSTRLRAFLDSVNAASLVLMAYATVLLARSALVSFLPIAIFVVSLVLLWKTKINPAWLLACGAIAGLIAQA